MDTGTLSVTDRTANTILHLLQGGQRTGFEIASEMAHRGNRTFFGKEAALYPLLHTMEKKGLIRSRLRDVPGSTERRFYRLTHRGKIALGPGEESRPLAPRQAHPIPKDKDFSLRIIRLRRWCNDAVLNIRVSPDKEIVSRELYDHLYDRFLDFLSQGHSADEAEKMTYDAMGSVKDVSRQLGELHRPLGTLALRTTRWILVVLAALTLYTSGLHYMETNFFRSTRQEYSPRATPAISGDHRMVRTFASGGSVSSDGYTITLAGATLWLTTDTDTSGNPRERQILNIQLDVFNPVPWAEEPDFASWIWAEDSLGNYYYCAYEDSLALEPSISVADYHTGVLTYTHDLWIYNYVSQDAQWLELHYDRSGRDITLRIDLTGGDTP